MAIDYNDYGPGFRPDSSYESGMDYQMRVHGDRSMYPEPVVHKEINPKDLSPGWQPGGGYMDAEAYMSAHGDRPAIQVYQEEPSYEQPDDYDARIYGNRDRPRFGEKIDLGNGPVNITTLVENGKLTPETLKPEDAQKVYIEIMKGLTNDKNLLAVEIGLIISNDEMVRDMVMNQYNLAVTEMQKEKRGYHDTTSVNRKYQFLATLSILEAKGYDITGLKFPAGENKEVDMLEVLQMFQQQCRENAPVSLMPQSPLWFNGAPPANYDPRRATNPVAVATGFVRDIYEKDPERFISEFERRKAVANTDAVKNQTFDQFMMQQYGFVPVNKVEEFKAARAEQQAADKKERDAVLSVNQPELTETAGRVI